MKDTLSLKILSNKNRYISNYAQLPPPNLPLDPKNDSTTISHSEYISSILEINDNEFVKNQFRDNQDFNFDKLIDYGFNLLDVKGFINKGITYTKILEYTEKNENYGFMTISTPFFNKKIEKKEKDIEAKTKDYLKRQNKFVEKKPKKKYL